MLAIQHSEVVFSLAASFQAPEDGIAHQRPRPAAPRPEDSADAASVMAAADPATQAWYTMSRQQFLVEMRFPEGLPQVATARDEPGPAPRQRIWVRAGQPLSDDPLLHACAVTYVSDLLLRWRRKAGAQEDCLAEEAGPFGSKFGCQRLEPGGTHGSS